MTNEIGLTQSELAKSNLCNLFKVTEHQNSGIDTVLYIRYVYFRLATFVAESNL